MAEDLQKVKMKVSTWNFDSGQVYRFEDLIGEVEQLREKEVFDQLKKD